MKTNKEWIIYSLTALVMTAIFVVWQLSHLDKNESLTTNKNNTIHTLVEQETKPQRAELKTIEPKIEPQNTIEPLPVEPTENSSSSLASQSPFDDRNPVGVGSLPEEPQMNSINSNFSPYLPNSSVGYPVPEVYPEEVEEVDDLVRDQTDLLQEKKRPRFIRRRHDKSEDQDISLEESLGDSGDIVFD